MFHSGQIIGDMALESIIYYNKISGRPDVPEGFIRDQVADRYHQATNCKISIELPMRVFTQELGVDAGNLAGLGSFRVDMAAFRPGHIGTARNLDLLVEIKKWTNRHAAAKDIRRLKQMLSALSNHADPIGGYVVVCPQYPQGMDMLNIALDDFSQRFPICYDTRVPLTSDDGKLFGVGIAVINIHDCREGNFG